MSDAPPTDNDLSYAQELGIENPGQYVEAELARLIERAVHRDEKLVEHKQLMSDAKRLGLEIPVRATSVQLRELIQAGTTPALESKGIVVGAYVKYLRHGICRVEKYNEGTSRITLRPVTPGRVAHGHEAWLVAIHAEVCEPPGDELPGS